MVGSSGAKYTRLRNISTTEGLLFLFYSGLRE